MRRLTLLFLTGCLLLLVYACSDTPTSTEPAGEEQKIMMVQRPEFVDERPPQQIEAAIIAATSDFGSELDKKPPHPHDPPDTSSADPNPDPAHKYAYIVGIADYDGSANDLMYPDDDAMAMKSYLQGEGFSVSVDLNGNATADDITAGLQWLVNQAQPGDEIAFCYSGHGSTYPGYGSCIISSDLYYMTHGYVMQIFNSADCSKKMVTLDCCVIGDFHQDCQTGTMMATASNKTDSYDVPAFHHGAWTYFWLEAVNDQGYIYAEEAATYAEEEMTAWAKPYHLRVSPKHTDKYTGMFDM